MQFIKKLVILTGGGARGTLMLEKSGFGVWCRLNIFDLKAEKNCKFVIISGDSLFVMKLEAKRDQSISFKLGEIDFTEIHAAVLCDNVLMYGSNCATKLSPRTIVDKVARYDEKTKEQESYITFSGRERGIDDYFKKIAPPLYNDFALAEKNYYPAYVTVLGDEEETEVRIVDEHNIEAEEAEATAPEQFKKEEAALQPKQYEKLKEEIVDNKKITPHELEQRYLHLIEAAATLNKEKVSEVGAIKETHEEIKISNVEREEKKVQEQQTVLETQTQPTKITTAEKPEVIAMARRITLRDYRVEGAKPTGRKATFFERSSAQLDKLLSTNERFDAVEKLIPGSKFVKINYDQKRYYIVGVIGRDYICYGVPSVYSEVPPEPLFGYARWLPFDAEKPHADGFWMMYQDGVSGETLKS